MTSSLRTRASARLAALALAVFAGLTPAPVRAQIGATTDIIQGTVVDEVGKPVENATVEVLSIDLNITRRARTNAQGRYTVLFPDGGGQYQVTIRFLGKAPVVVNVSRQSDEDRLIADARMTQNPTRITGVTVQARQTPANQLDRPTPGSTERAITTDQAARLPIDASDLTQLALTAPGVVSIGGTDSTAAAFSVAGQRPTGNNITLDGLSFGATQVPQEAMRTTRVITNTYDVSRGQFSGGLISSTTRSGTNAKQGNFSYSLRDEALAWEGGDPSPLAQGYTQNQLSGGFGFPVVKDQLFAFTSLQLRRRTDIVPSLLNADAATLGRFGIVPDSVTRFLGLASGAGIAPGLFFDDNRLQDNLSGLVRLDWLMPSGHSLTVRGDWRWNDQDPSRVSTLSLPQTGGTQKDWGGGFMATLTSNFGGRFLNELKTYVSATERTSRPFITLPSGRVQIASDLADARSIATLQFGGNAGLPTENRTRALETTNELSWLAGGHRLKLGGLVSYSIFEQDGTFNRNGTFLFNSLADFAANRPAQFTRTLQPSLRDGSQLNTALYVGDTWRQSRAWQWNFGLRLEGGKFGNAPANNPVVESAFGHRTDFVPGDVRVSPRIGFSYTRVGANGPPRFFLRGGVGEFRSLAPSGLFSAAAAATGLLTGESQLVCIGPSVPVPDWSLFTVNASNIPTQCSGGGNQFTAPRPQVTLFDRDFAAPRSWRMSLGGQKFLFGRYNLNVDASWSLGVAQTGYRDLNLATTPKFALTSEGGRPVYVDPLTIVPITGTTSLFGSRKDPQFGQVLAVGSDLKSDNRQLTVGFGGITSRGAILNVSYTWAHARDQSSSSGFGGGGGFASATTAGDPNVREWSLSDFSRTHSFTGSVTYPLNLSVEITAFGRVSSGAAFTPMVGSDINGDGARNDRAFIFDPATAGDPVVASGMQRLLAGAPDAVRECLLSQTGRVAGRNTCQGVWQPTLDLQLNWRPPFWGLNRRLSVSVNTSNFLGGLDQLFHGSDNLHGWGVFRGQDNTLLYARGFDPAANRYLYQVNERFGASRQGQNGIRVPFQLGVQARYTLGPDRMREMIMGMIRGGGGGGRAGGAGPGGGGGRAGGGGGERGGLAGAVGAARDSAAGGGNAIRAFANALNPVMGIINLKDSLRLSDEQVVKLRPISDSLQARNLRITAEMQKEFANAGANPDMGALMGRMRPRQELMQKNSEGALKEVQEILSAEQWAKVPPRLKDARRGLGGLGAPGGDGPRRRPPGAD